MNTNETEGLSFLPDIMTIAVSVLQRRLYLILTALVSVVVGVVMAFLFGSQIWQTESVLLYKPAENELADEYEVLQRLDDTTTFVYRQGTRTERRATSGVQIQTLINTVKIPANLDAVRTELQLPVPLSVLGSAIGVHLVRDTELILVRAEWDDPQVAQAIVNTLVHVFIEANSRVNQENLLDMQGRLTSRLAQVSGQLSAVQQRLDEFSDQHRIVDIRRESEQYVSELIRLRSLRDAAISLRDSLRNQQQELEVSITSLQRDVSRERVEMEQRPTAARIEARIATLNRELTEQRERQAAMAELTVRDAELERVQRLHAEGLASNAELQRVRSAREAALAATQQAGAAEDLLREIDELQAMIPAPQTGASPTEQLLRELELRRFEIQMQLIEADASYNAYRVSVVRMEQSVDSLPALNREFVRLNTETAGLTAEVMGMERMLAEVRTAITGGASDFRIISQAPLPLYPFQSNRRLLAVAIVFGLGFVSWGGLVVREAMDRRFRAPQEVENVIHLAVIGAFRTSSRDVLIPEPLDDGPEMERFRILALRIRKQLPVRGVRIQMVSAVPQSGTTVVAAGLARVWGRSDERVLVIEAETRGNARLWPLVRFCVSNSPSGLLNKARMLRPDGAAGSPGLSDYLSFRSAGPDDIIQPTMLPGVDVITRGQVEALPDLLGSHRFQELLEVLSQRYSVVLVDSPAIQRFADSALIHPLCDAALFVIRSRTVRPETVLRALRELEPEKVIGLVMTDVMGAFMEDHL